ncbi:MAG: hypothetical protein V3S03_08540 [Vicinamibacteria bacterium]
MARSPILLEVRVRLPFLWLGALTGWIARWTLLPFLDEDQVDQLVRGLSRAIVSLGWIKIGTQPWQRISVDDVDEELARRGW